MARGNRKTFYAFRIERTNPGVGGDALLIQGGYAGDAAIAAGAYPEVQYQMQETEAMNKCRQGVSFFQSQGIDARGEVLARVFGEDADTPARALGAGEDGPFVVMRIDSLENTLKTRIRLANQDVTLGDAGDDLPHDVDAPVGG